MICFQHFPLFCLFYLEPLFSQLPFFLFSHRFLRIELVLLLFLLPAISYVSPHILPRPRSDFFLLFASSFPAQGIRELAYKKNWYHLQLQSRSLHGHRPRFCLQSSLFFLSTCQCKRRGFPLSLLTVSLPLYHCFRPYKHGDNLQILH